MNRSLRTPREYNERSSAAAHAAVARAICGPILLRICAAAWLLGSALGCELKNLDYLSAGTAGAGSGGGSTADAGSGNASGGGGSGARVCEVNGKMPPPPCNRATLIDDMEDGDGTICAVGGRAGLWEAYSDGTGIQTPSSGLIRGGEDMPECRGFSSRALHVQGIGFTSWGMGVDLNLADHTAYSVTGYVGLRFWAKSTTDTLTHVRANVATLETLDASFGGVCAPTQRACNDHFGVDLVISGSWVLYDITFKNMTQAGWGVAASWNSASAMQVHWVFKDSDFDVWIDDVEFIT